MEQFFFELTIIILIASVLSLVFRILKQPAILAYILTGIIVGPLGLFTLHEPEILESFAQIGVTLLLFLLGLELRLSDLKSVGRTALVTGIGQIVFTSVIGYGLCLLFGFSPLASVYIAIALTFSSTIIIVKLLSDKKDLNSLYGKISVGFLLIQDFVAILALIFLSGFNAPEGISIVSFVFIIVKAVLIFGATIILSRTVLPKLMISVAKNEEILFVFSLAFAFGVALLVSSEMVGFTIEIGGFLAGLALANSVTHIHIASRVRSLRDFFIVIFFVALGTQMAISHIETILTPAILLSLFVLIGNPLIVMILLGILGYKRRTGLLAGLTVAQISEFSLIVMFMGNKLGHVPDEAVALVTIVGVVTFVFSTYMILNGHKIYQFLGPYLMIFEKKKVREEKMVTNEKSDHVILIGANRMGESIVEAMIKHEHDIVVVDFDPDVVTRLKSRGIDCLYGDISDDEIQNAVGLQRARLIISTVPDVEDNLYLLNGIKKRNTKAISVFFALETDDAKRLYEAGAKYVVLPHLAGGQHLAKILVDKNHLELIEEYKAKDSKYFT